MPKQSPTVSRARPTRTFVADVEVPLSSSHREAADGDASSIRRALDVLTLIDERTPLLRVDDVMARWSYPRSTAYRYIRELSDVGLLAPTTNGAYALGPRAVELDRMSRLTDPLYVAGNAVLPPLLADDRVLMLQTPYRDDTMCILKVGPDVLERADRRIVIERSRGLPFPLFRGAGSLVLLACLSPHRIRETYLANLSEISAAGLGDDWATFRRTIGSIRKVGHVVRRGRTGLMAFAVPIIPDGDARAVGSLVECFIPNASDDGVDAARLDALVDVGRQIAAIYARVRGVMASSARTV